MFQLDSATFVLLAHTNNSWLENFTGLQNEHLESSESKVVSLFPGHIPPCCTTVTCVKLSPDLCYCYGYPCGLTGQRSVETVGLQACRSSSIQKSTVSCLGDFTSGTLTTWRYRMNVSMMDATYLKETR